MGKTKEGSKFLIRTGKRLSFDNGHSTKFPSPRMCELCKKITTCRYVKKPDTWPSIYIYQCLECCDKHRRKSIT